MKGTQSVITYRSTRAPSGAITLETAIADGLARDGGLNVPNTLPHLDMDAVRAAAANGYAAVAEMVLAPFFKGTRLEAEAGRLIGETYSADVFRHADVAPLTSLGKHGTVLELFHGPTLAFKDFALQLLGRLFDALSGAQSGPLTILGATSGDTGSAAIEACRGRDNVRIVMLHPKGRVSEVQRRQMTTVVEDNVLNIAVEGSFDDCQALVKAAFGDLDFRDRMHLTAVHSINWARIMAQIVYYVWAVVQPAYVGKSPSFSVPTGNFGDIYAGYLARRMGAPIGELMIATNANDILVRTLETGAYRKAAAEPSLSPSMDIQVASNFERLLLDAYGGDAAAVAANLTALKEAGVFQLSADALAYVRSHFRASRASDADCIDVMTRVWADTGYCVDPHTATGLVAAQALENPAEVITLGTAHPAKFPGAVRQAIGEDPTLPPHMAGLFDRPERMTTLPADLGALKAALEAF